MADRRRPVWLTDIERRVLDELVSTHGHADVNELDLLGAIVGRPVPWLTVNDAGQVVRMEVAGVIEACIGEFYADQSLDETEGTPLYRAVLGSVTS